MTQLYTYTCAKLPQCCPARFDPLDCGPPGSPTHGIMPSVLYSFLLRFIPGERIQSPGPHRKALLLIRPVRNTLHLGTPDSHAIFAPNLATTSLLPTPVSLSLLYREVHLYRILDPTSTDIYGVSLSLSDLLRLVRSPLGPSVVRKRRSFILRVAE